MTDVRNVSGLVIEMLGSATTMKLQKLLYYCQGWHLAWDGVPLFDASIEAWANGPVVREVYDLHRGEFRFEHPLPDCWHADSSRLSSDERETVESVVEHYRSWTADQLSRSTHRERPWIEARRGLAATERGNSVIDLDTMQDYFTGLMEDPSIDA